MIPKAKMNPRAVLTLDGQKYILFSLVLLQASPLFRMLDFYVIRLTLERVTARAVLEDEGSGCPE